jgi:hypothetical protein
LTKSKIAMASQDSSGGYFDSPTPENVSLSPPQVAHGQSQEARSQPPEGLRDEAHISDLGLGNEQAGQSPLSAAGVTPALSSVLIFTLKQHARAFLQTQQKWEKELIPLVLQEFPTRADFDAALPRFRNVLKHAVFQFKYSELTAVEQTLVQSRSEDGATLKKRLMSRITSWVWRFIKKLRKPYSDMDGGAGGSR